MFNMKIEHAVEEHDKITIITTGAKFVFNKSGDDGEIVMYQRLGKERMLGRILLQGSIKNLTLEAVEDDFVILHMYKPGRLKIKINADSLIDFYSAFGINGMSFIGNFKPQYTASQSGDFLVMDEYGGIGFYPDMSHAGYEEVTSCFLGDAWRLMYPFKLGRGMLISLFPPRPWDAQISFDQRIIHHANKSCPYPSDEMIEHWSRFGNILILHEENWLGKMTRRGLPCDISTREGLDMDMPWANYHYIPRDEAEMRRVIDTAHRCGMKVLPYMSPYHGIADGDMFQQKIGMVLGKYGVDGIYFDELFVGNNVKEAYTTITETRKRHGDILLYMHCTGSNRFMYCPAVDTYADCILRGEHLYPFDLNYLRYVISGYNISNSIGYVCLEGPIDFKRKLIDACLLVNARLPYWVPSDKEFGDMMENVYFPKLEKLGLGEDVPLEIESLMQKDDQQVDQFFIG